MHEMLCTHLSKTLATSLNLKYVKRVRGISSILRKKSQYAIFGTEFLKGIQFQVSLNSASAKIFHGFNCIAFLPNCITNLLYPTAFTMNLVINYIVYMQQNPRPPSLSSSFLTPTQNIDSQLSLSKVSVFRFLSCWITDGFMIHPRTKRMLTPNWYGMHTIPKFCLQNS